MLIPANAKQVTQLCDITLFPGTKSWYMGANIPGKPLESLNYTGGVPRYGREVDEKAQKGYEGFTFGPERDGGSKEIAGQA